MTSQDELPATGKLVCDLTKVFLGIGKWFLLFARGFSVFVMDDCLLTVILFVCGDCQQLAIIINLDG